MRLVECVPNFSEGRDATVIGAIADAISSTPKVSLLDIDSSASANRTVMTFAGTPEAVSDAAFAGIAKAAELIDMRIHRGAHPRLGATDVCPFVPLSEVTMDDCVSLARELGSRVAQELGVPVFLYAEAALKPNRYALPAVRRGEYEGLLTRFEEPGSEPDFGTPRFNERSGATIIGARPILIAYNINLDTTSAELARKIASEVRESGSITSSPDRMIKEQKPGRLKACRAIGWYMEEYRCAQVSMNLLDYRITGMHTAYDEVCRVAEKLGTSVKGSELIGLVPLRAVLDAADHYAAKLNMKRLKQPDLIKLAVDQLGLNNLKPFDAQHKILDNNLASAGFSITA